MFRKSIQSPGSIALAGLFIGVSAVTFAQQSGNPLLPPQATLHPERDREYDLQHVLLRLKIDEKNKTFSGNVVETLTPLRKTTAIHFDALDSLQIQGVSVAGRQVPFEHSKNSLTVNLPVAVQSRGGLPFNVTIKYALKSGAKTTSSLNGEYGFHWIEPHKYIPNKRLAFYTQGETEGNRGWVPIYDYPNDKTTTETYVEAPASRFIVGNGRLMGIENNTSAHRRTFHWKMTQPHSTYLLSLVGGEMDVVRDTWQGVDLYYCVPKGEGGMIPASFGDTKDMLTFFSNRLGVKYPWPKYAQTCSFDFGGGMENVSATTLGEGSLVERRNGIWPMASLNSHELAHQWFGDLITAKDWGHIWLNEGFATFFEQIYLEHSRGKDAYDREREGALQAYLGESRRYKRAIVTQYYTNPDAMFDSHTYPKGGLVLHMLRRILGDDDFYYGLGYYLKKYGYHPVDTNDLIRAFTESVGRNMQPFFDQWVYKPGHPVVDYSWKYDDANQQVVIDVNQTQDTKDGTPVYNIDMPYQFITGSNSITGTFSFSQVKQTIKIDAKTKPDAVVIDPGHDILMERKVHNYTEAERLAILRAGSSYLDQRTAAQGLISQDESDDKVKSVLDIVIKANKPFLLSEVLNNSNALARPALRDTLRTLTKNNDPSVKTAAINLLGRLKKDDDDVKLLRTYVNDIDMYSVVEASMTALANWDAKANLELFKVQASRESRFGTLRRSALAAIGHDSDEEAMNIIINYLKPGMESSGRFTAIRLLGGNYKSFAPGTKALIDLLKDDDKDAVSIAAQTLGVRGDKSAISALKDLEANTKDDNSKKAATKAIETLQKS